MDSNWRQKIRKQEYLKKTTTTTTTTTTADANPEIEKSENLEKKKVYSVQLPPYIRGESHL